MAAKSSSDRSGFEFEQFPGRADIQVTKVMTTPKGDKIRAIVTTGDSVVLTGIGRRNSDTVVVTGEPGSLPTDPVVYNSTWDKIIEIGIGILKDLLGDGGGGGGGEECHTIQATVDATVDGKATKVSISVKTCNPA